MNSNTHRTFPASPSVLAKILFLWISIAGSVSAMNLVDHNYSTQCGTGYSFDGGFWIPSIDIGDNAVPGQYIFQRAGPHGNNGAVTVTIGTDGSVSWGGDFGNVVAGAVSAYGNDWGWSVGQVPAGGTASVTGEFVTTTTACDAPIQPSNAFGTAYIQIGSSLPPFVKPCDAQIGGDGCPTCGGAGPGKGMARYSAHSMLASLHIEDTPIGYTPPRGPAINFTVGYNQREPQQAGQATVPNLGPRWTFNWISYVTDDPANLSANVSVYVAGGGTETFSGYNAGTQSYSADPQSHAILVRIQTSPITYEERFPDGSKRVYAQSDNASSSPRRVLMTEYWDAAGQKATVDFHSSSSLLIDSITDALSYKTTFLYDNPNYPFRIHQINEPTQFGTRSAVFNYDSNGRLQTITDEIGIQSAFTYSTNGTNFITSLQTPYGTTSFAAGATGTNKWLEITDPLTGKERIEYKDGAISASEPVAPTGMTNSGLDVANTFYFDKKYTADHGATYNYTQARITHWAKASGGSPTGIVASIKAPLENRVWYSYDGQSDTNHVGPSASPNQIARILEDGSTQLWQYQYNSMGKMTQLTDPVGRVMSYVYDTNNIDLLTVRQTTSGANDLLRTLTYNSLREPLTDKDAAGQTTTYTYRSDGHGQIQSVQNAKGETTTYTYGPTTGVPADYLASVTSPTFNGSNAITSFTYDTAHRVRTVTNNPDNYTVTTDYDNLDRPTTVTYPDATTQTFGYTQDFGQGAVQILDLTTSTDRRGRTTTRHYDKNRHIDSLTEPYGNSSTRTTNYGWCTCGSLTSITDPNQHTTTFNRDLQSRVYQKVFADNTSINYLYEGQTSANAVGTGSRLKSMSDAKNQRTNYSYFADDNLQQISYTDTSGQPLNPATPTVNFTYDPNYNRVATMTDGTGTTTYGYYAVTNPPALGATQLQTVDGPLANDTITYSYDELGRAVSQSINGVSSSGTYDSLGRLNTSDNPLGHFTRAYESNVTPRLKTLTSPTGQTANYTYFDNSHDRRLQTLQDLTSGSANITKFDYTYDPEGQIYPTWVRQLSTSPATTSNLTYESADQLTQVVNTTPNNPSTTFTYGYDPAGNRTSDSSATYSFNDAVNEITNTGYTYDADGNLTADGVKTYQWDAANRMTKIIYPGTAGRTEFTYDGLGRRVKIVEKNNPGAVLRTSNFIWSGMTIAEERDASNTVVKRFLAEGVQLPTGTTPNTKLYYSKDHLGSIRSLTNENGTIVGTLDYDAFGGISQAPVPANDTSGSGPVLISAISRLTHGSYGTFDLNLPLTGAPGIEMRSGTNYTLVLTFDRNVLSDTSTTIAAGIGTVGSTTFSGNTATISLSGVSDRQTITVELDNVVGVTGVNSKVLVSISVLVGDVNQTGAVTVEDYTLVLANSGAVADSSTFKYDVTHNGIINSSDYGYTQTLAGQGDSLYPDFTFTGHYYHARSGLCLAPYRAYNPTIGRWLSRDPIGEEGGLNLYDYAENNPTNWVDRLGLDIRIESTNQVGGLHRRISVDTPNGPYGQSFGLISWNLPSQGFSEASGVKPGFGVPGSGIVYPDPDPTRLILEVFRLTPEEDAIALALLQQDLKKTGPYNPFSRSCRDYSQERFREITDQIANRRLENVVRSIKAWFAKVF